MADTRRQTILKAVADLVENAKVCKTVERMHPNPWEVANPPAALIYPRWQKKSPAPDDQVGSELSVVIAVIVEGPNLQDALEPVLTAVEGAINADPSLGGTVDDSRITDVQFELVEITAPRAGAYVFIECDYDEPRS